MEGPDLNPQTRENLICLRGGFAHQPSEVSFSINGAAVIGFLYRGTIAFIL